MAFVHLCIADARSHDKLSCEVHSIRAVLKEGKSIGRYPLFYLSLALELGHNAALRAESG